MEANELYSIIPTSTVQMIQNEAYVTINDGVYIDISKNQAYMSATAAGVNVLWSHWAQSWPRHRIIILMCELAILYYRL